MVLDIIELAIFELCLNVKPTGLWYKFTMFKF